MTDEPRRQRNLRPLWWVLFLLGVAIGVGGYLGGTRYYPHPETKDLGNLAFWGMLGGGCLALYGFMQLIAPALNRGLDRVFGSPERRRGGR